jgi:drug/metabolite transporter (DMT)-like permease
MGLAFTGLLVLFADGLLVNTGTLLGDALVLASGALLGARFVYTRSLTQGIDPIRLLVWQDIMAVPVFVALSLAFESFTDYSLGSGVVPAVLYQGLVVAGFCFVIQVNLIKRYQTASVSAFGFATPVFGVSLSALLLGEGVTWTLAASLALVTTGILLANRSSVR